MSVFAAYGLAVLAFTLGVLVGALCYMARYPDIDTCDSEETTHG